MIEKLSVAVAQRISKEFLDWLAEDPIVRTSVYTEFMCDEIVLRVVLKIFGEDLQNATVKYPENWKEAIKDRFMPGWAKKMWPVRYTVHHIDVLALYPKATIPDKARVVIYQEQSTTN